MEKYWSAYITGEVFKHFGVSHIFALLIIIFFNVLVITFIKKVRSEKAYTVYRYFLCFLIVSLEVLNYFWFIDNDMWSIMYCLPLHICDMAAVFSIIMLLGKNKFIYQITYFWGLAGVTQALLTPALWYDFPHFQFFQFFIIHGCVISAVLEMTIIEKLRPTFRSLIKTFVFTNFYLKTKQETDGARRHEE